MSLKRKGEVESCYKEGLDLYFSLRIQFLKKLKKCSRWKQIMV